MAILRPDTSATLNGVKINEYLLTKHNPNHIDMPSVSMEGKVIGVTVHNTDWISVASGTTPAEQYTRATVNGNMKDVRVHYYVDNVCAWQNLPLSLSGWHAADGGGNGNRRTVSIECIMSSAYNDKDKKSEDNCARLAAALLKKKAAHKVTMSNGLFRKSTRKVLLMLQDAVSDTNGKTDTMSLFPKKLKLSNWCFKCTFMAVTVCRLLHI